MTSTFFRTSEALAEWTKVFPRQVTETYTSSATFMKQLTIVALSTITYLKNAFPEDNYTIDQFGGLKIRVLKKTCDDELAQFLITALTQAFEAFDKKYLQQLALCFYSGRGRGDGDRLLEYHVFEYAYLESGAALSLRSGGPGAAATEGGSCHVSFDDVRQRTVQLLRACMVMLSHSPLPDTYDVSLRLYYNEAAPADYQAPGYLCADDVTPLDARDALTLGGVRTRHHSVQLRSFQRDMRSASPDSCRVAASQNTPAMSQDPEDLPGERIDGEADALRVRCECLLQDSAALQCRYCGTRQHAECYGRDAGLQAGLQGEPDEHCCVRCADAGLARSDPALQTAPDRAGYAIFRRALCSLQRSVAAGARLQGGALAARLRLGTRGAARLLHVLHSLRLLASAPNDLATPLEVDNSRLAAAVREYFPCAGGVPARLLDESQAHARHELPASQESHASRAELSAADPALAQYRAALGSLGTETSGQETEPALPAAAPTDRKRTRSQAHPLTRAGVNTKRIKTNRK